MNIWFFDDQQRLIRERTTLRNLEETAPWLLGATWVLADGLLCLDVIIRAHDHDYPVRMTYPSLFPSIPPSVRPQDADAYWSSHQYGTGGSLCLEWGPDTWHPDVTGSQVLESAYNLLEIENPLGTGSGEGVTTTAPSRHHLSIGQAVRNRYGRLYLAKKLNAYLNALQEGASGEFKFSVNVRASSLVAIIHEVQPTGEGAAEWHDDLIPRSLRGGQDDSALRRGVFYKTDIAPEVVSRIKGIQHIVEFIGQAGFEVDAFDEAAEVPSGALIIDGAGNPHFFFVLGRGETDLLRVALVRAEEASVVTDRLPHNLEGLSDKSVGIVGVGSIGSKVALSLARMGIKKFYIVDEDVFFPENISRHVLDWRYVGEHKVEAMKETLSRIASGVEIEVSNLHLTGQESTAALSAVLNRLGCCDLLVDATADASVFNLLCAVAATFEKPLVWMQVYAGGVGGMIARCRPGLDPSPQTMRRQAYDQYCLEHPAPEPHVVRDYTVEDADGQVLAASDADVAIIAHHAARLAVDTVLMRHPSVYPYSLYLIGLEEWWVFKAPFHTIPIATDHLRSAETKSEEMTEEDAANNAEFLIGLLKKGADATAASS